MSVHESCECMICRRHIGGYTGEYLVSVWWVTNDLWCLEDRIQMIEYEDDVEWSIDDIMNDNRCSICVLMICVMM